MPDPLEFGNNLTDFQVNEYGYRTHEDHPLVSHFDVIPSVIPTYVRTRQQRNY